MSETDIEELLGHYLDNVQSAVSVCMDFLDEQDLTENEREDAIALIKKRIAREM